MNRIPEKIFVKFDIVCVKDWDIYQICLRLL